MFLQKIFHIFANLLIIFLGISFDFCIVWKLIIEMRNHFLSPRAGPANPIRPATEPTHHATAVHQKVAALSARPWDFSQSFVVAPSPSRALPPGFSHHDASDKLSPRTSISRLSRPGYAHLLMPARPLRARSPSAAMRAPVGRCAGALRIPPGQVRSGQSRPNQLGLRGHRPPNPVLLGYLPVGKSLHWARERHIAEHSPCDDHLSRPRLPLLTHKPPTLGLAPAHTPRPARCPRYSRRSPGRPVSAATPSPAPLFSRSPVTAPLTASFSP
jgi:hypothetical protein